MKKKCPNCGGMPVQIRRVLDHYELKCSYCWWHDTVPIRPAALSDPETAPVAA